MDKGIQAARLADQIRDYLAVWANQDLQGYLFSFTQVTMSPDLSQATVWVEILVADHKATILRKLRDRIPAYQRKLVRELGKRTSTSLSFILDNSAEEFAKLDNLLN